MNVMRTVSISGTRIQSIEDNIQDHETSIILSFILIRIWGPSALYR